MKQFIYSASCLLGLCFLLLSHTAYAKTEEEYQQDIRVLQKRNTQLENNLEQITSDLKNKAQQIKLLQEQIAEIARQGEDGVKEVQETRRAMKQLKKQLKNLLEQQDTNKIQGLKEQLSKTLQENQQLVQQITILAKEKDALQKEITQLQKASSSGNTETKQQLEDRAAKTLLENQLLEKQLNRITEDKKRLQQELDALKHSTAATTDTTRVQQELIALHAELEKQKRQFKANLALLAQRDRELEAANTQLRKMKTMKSPSSGQQPSQTETRIKELEATLATMNTKLMKYSQENSRLKAQRDRQPASILPQQGEQFSTLKESMMKLQKQLEQLTQENAQLEAQVKHQQERRHNDITAKDAEIARLENNLREVTETMNMRSAATQLTEEQASTLKASLTGLRGQLETLTHENKQLETQITQQQDLWHTDVVTRDAEIARLEGELRKAADYINTYTAEITSLKQQNADMKVEMEKEQGSYTNLRSQAEQDRAGLQSRLQTAEAERTSLQANLHTVKQERDRLQASIQETERQNSQLQQTISTLQKQLDEKGSVPDAARKRIEELVEELQTVKAQLDTQNRLETERPLLQQEIESLRKELASLRANNQTLQETVRDKEAQIEAQRTAEQQYQEGRKELELKEKLLQQALMEKAVLEKVVDDENCTPKTLDTLQQQRLQQQQLEAELKKAQQRIAKLTGQSTQQSPAISPAPLPTSLPKYDVLQTIFPQGVQSNGTISVLNWSPDKSKLAYLETRDQLQQLWIVRRFTQRPVKIAEWQASSSLTSTLEWAYDNHHFVFATGISGQYTLYLGNSDRLLGSPIPISDQHIDFAWSPTQLQFAYFSGTKLIIQNTKSQVFPIEIGHQPGLSGTSLAWSPDGTQIALSAKRGASFDISLLHFSGNTPVLQSFVASPSDDVRPSWSPDGQHIAFYVCSTQYDTKVAVSPVNQSRAPYIVGHNASLPRQGGPRWLTPEEVVYMGTDQRSASHDLMIYRVDIATGQRSSVPLTMLFPQ